MKDDLRSSVDPDGTEFRRVDLDQLSEEMAEEMIEVSRSTFGLAVPGRLDVVETLLADAIAIARAAGSSGVECFLSGGHPYRAALRRQGLIDSRIDIHLEYHPIAASMDDLRPLADPSARLHFQIGDTDLV